MATTVLVLLVGLALLAWGATRFVDGTAATARHLGVPPLLIGMTVVGFGTSAPELSIAGLASTSGTPSLAVGNALGASIANLTLILGLVALVLPVTLNSRALRGQTALLAIAVGLLYGMSRDGTLSRPEGLVLFGLLGAGIVWNVRRARRLRDDVLAAETVEGLEARDMPRWQGAAWALAGLATVLLSGQIIVWSSTQLARAVGLSDLVIGLTVVALGTTTPELATSVMAALKREDDLALGNVIGSNLFNLTAVIGLAATLQPTSLPPAVLTRDLPLLGTLTLGLMAMSYRGGRVGRLLGGGLLLVYGAYVARLLAGAGG